MKSFICFIMFLCGVFAICGFVAVSVLFVPYNTMVTYNLPKYLVALLALTMLAGIVSLVFVLFEEDSGD